MSTVNSLPVIRWQPLKEIADRRKAALLTSPSAENSITGLIEGINIVNKIYLKASTKSEVEKLKIKKPNAEVVYAVGGGAVMDIGRYLASRWNLEIICVPTIISSDAFLVDCTGLRVNGCISYIASKKADLVILDWEILKNVPNRFHISGCGDVLSIFTGLEDWKYANQTGNAQDDEVYSKPVGIMADSILNALTSDSNEIKNGTQHGLKTIVTTLAMEVALCNFYGNSRPEEGGEHFFAYCIENYTKPFLHGEMVGFGILLTSYLQRQNWKKMKNFMDIINLNYKPEGLSQELVIKVLKELPEYVKKHKLKYSIYNDFSYSKKEWDVDNFFKEICLNNAL